MMRSSLTAIGSGLLLSCALAFAIGCESNQSQVTSPTDAETQLSLRALQLAVPQTERFDLELDESSVVFRLSDTPGMIGVEVDFALYRGINLNGSGDWQIRVLDCDGDVIGDYVAAARTIWETAEGCKENAAGECASVGAGCPDLDGYTSFGCLRHSGCKCKYVRDATAFELPYDGIAAAECLTFVINPGNEGREADASNNSVTVKVDLP